MSGASRQGIDSAGGVIIGGSPNVLTNKTGQVRIGDAVQGHDDGEHRSPVMATGSDTVFVNGIPACKEGDVATCGHQSTGSSNVIIG